MNKIPFFQHDLGSAELQAIAEVLSGPMLTTGDTVARFESEFGKLLNASHVLGVTSCTGALHMSLLALGIGAGDEVITCPMTFVATAAAIVEAGAKPVFVDAEPLTGNIDTTKIESAITPRTRAIIPVHLYGQLCDMRSLKAIADKYHLALIEDAAHCIEGTRDAVKPGALSDTACFSFFATKNITCGEGGAVTTNNPDLFRKLKPLRLHGITKTSADRYREGYQHWDMLTLGWKYNMDNIQAAMLLPQLGRIEQNRMRRERLANQFRERLCQTEGISFPAVLPKSTHAHHLFPVWVEASHRDEIIHELQNRGIPTVVNYRPIHLLTYFHNLLGYHRGAFPEAERIGDCTISLPLYPTMPEEHVDIVSDELIKILKRRSPSR